MYVYGSHIYGGHHSIYDGHNSRYIYYILYIMFEYRGCGAHRAEKEPRSYGIAAKRSEGASDGARKHQTCERSGVEGGPLPIEGGAVGGGGIQSHVIFIRAIVLRGNGKRVSRPQRAKVSSI